MWPRGFLFDADDTAGITPAAAEPAAPATPEPAAPAAPEATPAPAAWSGPSEDEWLETQQLLRSLANPTGAQQPTTPGAQQAPSFEIDPFDDGFGEQLVNVFGELLDAKLGERLGPIQARQAYEERQESEQRAKDILADYSSQIGTEFDTSVARTLAEPLLAASFERYGVTPRAAEMALHQAADQLIAHDKAVAERAVNEYKASLERLSQAPTEPGGSTSGVEVVGDADSEYDAVQRAMARLASA